MTSYWLKSYRLHYDFPPQVGAVSIHSMVESTKYAPSIASRAGVFTWNISTQKTTNGHPLKSQLGNHGLVYKRKSLIVLHITYLTSQHSLNVNRKVNWS